MKWGVSLKFRTRRRSKRDSLEEIRVRRRGRQGIIPKSTSGKGGRLKIFQGVPKRVLKKFKKKRKY